MSNDNDTNSLTFDLPKNKSNVIKVLGVGGGGSNAIDYMYEQGISGVDFAICNTDAQALDNSPVPTKIQLGVNLTEGLGAGASPEIGQNAALESFDDIKNLITSNTKMLFITAGMGGGTGTGAAPIIAKQAKEMDILTVGIVTIPFQFEGKMRIQQANRGLERLREHVDSIIVINNNKLRQVYGNLGYRSGFSKADEVLSTAARGIAEVITHHFKQNVDLHDARTVLRNSGTAIMGSSQATGKERADKAIKQALDSPLLNDNKINGANNVLLLIVSGDEEVTLDEIGEINDYIQEQAGNNANIIMGVGDDESLGEAIAVTVIATGFQQEQQDELVNTEQKKIIHTLEDDQTAEQDLTSKPNAPGTSKINFSSAGYSGEEEGIKKHSLFDNPNDEANGKNAIDDQDSSQSQEDTDLGDIDEDDFNISEELPANESTEHGIYFDISGIESSSSDEDSKNKAAHSLDKDRSNYKKKQASGFNEKEQKQTKPKSKIQNQSLEKEKRKKEPGSNDEAKSDHTQQTTDEESTVKNEIGNIDPLNSSIDELKKQAAHRKAKMKRYNHRFNSKQNLDELEKQPAYKRAGVDLDQSNESDKESKISRVSLHKDDKKDTKLRKNNSYLHDNAD